MKFSMFNNNVGECKYTIQDGDGHGDWVSCVRFSPNTLQPTIVSSSWDKTVKIWNLTNCKLRATLAGHSGYVNTVAVSPDGSLCASGGKDSTILLWDLAEGKRLYSLDGSAIIHALCFSPNRYWLCAATEAGIKIWDLESKSIVEDLKVDLKTEADHDVEGAGTGATKKKVYYLLSIFLLAFCFRDCSLVICFCYVTCSATLALLVSLQFCCVH